MAFDLASASPVEQESGFDLASAQPVVTRKTPRQMAAERPDEEPPTQFRTSGDRKGYDPFSAAAQAGLAMASGAVAKPVSDVAGLAALGLEMTPWGPGGDPMAFKKAVQKRLTLEPTTEGGALLAGANP